MTDNQEVGPEAEVTLRETTEETVVQICNLSDTLSEQQQKMVAPNAQSIAQAHFSDKAWLKIHALSMKALGHHFFRA